MPNGSSWTDQKVDEFIGRLLQAGVLLSACVLLAGGALFLRQYGHAAPNYHVFLGEPAELRGLVPAVRGTLAFQSRAVIQLGLLLLIATPVARVAFSIFAFLEQHDRVYVVVTMIVLGFLIYGLAGASF
jgi:uncharacterized membrane protein